MKPIKLTDAQMDAALGARKTIDKIDKSIVDRATEWTAENYPNLDGPEFFLKAFEVAVELVELDRAADARELTHVEKTLLGALK